MKLTRSSKLRAFLVGAGLAVSALAFVELPAMAAFADGTCYTGCTPPANVQTQSPAISSTSSGTQPSSSSSTSSSSLPFTGADIEELAGIGAGAVVVGGLLVVRSRRRRVPA
jgi:LPXTG cell wall anchor motif